MHDKRTWLFIMRGRIALSLATFISIYFSSIMRFFFAAAFFASSPLSMVVQGSTAAPATTQRIRALNNVQQPLPPPQDDIAHDPQPPVQENNLRISLGKYGVDPFLPGSFSSRNLYALQVLQSETDDAYGGAFLSFSAPSGEGQVSSLQKWQLGKPNVSSVVALHRFKLWWMRPTHGKRIGEVPPETQLIIGEMQYDPKIGKKMYCLFLPLLDGPAKCSLKGMLDQSLQLFAETGCDKIPVPARDLVGLFVAVNDDPLELLDKSFKIVRKRLAGQTKGGALGGLIRDAEHALYSMKKSEVIPSRAQDRSAPDFSNYLGWCTWDSFYTGIDSEKVFEGLKSLSDAGVAPKWLVLDDGWQSTSNVDAKNGEQWMDHLTSLVANKKFRNEKGGVDLGETVKKAKAEHGIKYFLVWHAIAGYWAGVDLDSPDLFKYMPKRARLNAPPGIVEVDPDMKMFFRVCRFMNKRFGVVPPEHIRAFYDDYHSYLRSQGVDGVKVDAQSVVNFVGQGNGGSVEMAKAYHVALSKSVREHFKDADGEKGKGGRVIHCMCHDNEILLQLPSCYGRRPLIRGSDDFYPGDPASQSCHLYSNAFNALLIGHCGLQDWDMFQTMLGEVSWMHGASRAISGGPVYISDKPGQHNTDLLKKLVLEDGSILRAVHSAMPSVRTLFRNPQTSSEDLLIIWNENPAWGHGVIGAFNVYGSAWSQNKRAYNFLPGSDAVRESMIIDGYMQPRDCNVLVRQLKSEASMAKALDLKDTKDSSVQTKWRIAAAEASVHEGRINGEENSGSARYAVYLHHAQTLSIVVLDDELPVRLGQSQYELAAVSRVLRLPTGASTYVEWASVGLVDFFNAGGAITSEEVSWKDPIGTTHDESQDSGEGWASVSMTLKGSGKFLAHCTCKPSSVTINGKSTRFEYTNSTHETSTEGKRVQNSLSIWLPGPYDGKPRDVVVTWGAKQL